jgi:hypothetical protein
VPAAAGFDRLRQARQGAMIGTLLIFYD